MNIKKETINILRCNVNVGSRSLKNMIEVLGISWVNPRITDADYPFLDSIVGEWDVEVLRFSKKMKFEDIVKTIKVDGWQPATIHHLLALLSSLNGESLSRSVMAPGSLCVDDFEYPGCVVLGIDGTSTKLGLGNWRGSTIGEYDVMRVKRVGDISMEAAIKKIGSQTLVEGMDFLEIEDVTMIVQEDVEQTIPETGIGGFTPDSHTIFVYYDPANEHLQQNLQSEVRSTVTHELHHALRNRTFEWRKDTLLGAMITEGLADHFDIQMNGDSSKPWSVALSEDELKRVYGIAAPEFESRTYDHDAWFFGSEERAIPRWAGYALGFKMVADHLQKTGKTAAELVAEPAESFLP